MDVQQAIGKGIIKAVQTAPALPHLPVIGDCGCLKRKQATVEFVRRRMVDRGTTVEIPREIQRPTPEGGTFERVEI